MLQRPRQRLAAAGEADGGAGGGEVQALVGAHIAVERLADMQADAESEGRCGPVAAGRVLAAGNGVGAVDPSDQDHKADLSGGANMATSSSIGVPLSVAQPFPVWAAGSSRSRKPIAEIGSIVTGPRNSCLASDLLRTRSRTACPRQMRYRRPEEGPIHVLGHVPNRRHRGGPGKSPARLDCQC